MPTTKLDNISTAIERLVKRLRSAGGTLTKRMPLDKFVGYALAQIETAATEEPEPAQQRLSALKRTVDTLLARVAKMSAEDLESERIKVEVVTAFAPTKDSPMDDLTTSGDQSSMEVSLAGLSVATGDSALAENLNAVVKALRKMKRELEEPDDGKRRSAAAKVERQKRGGGSDAPGDDEDDGEHDADGNRDTRAAEDADPGGWPIDLNSDAFLKGDKDATTELTWGADPDEVATAKAR